MQILSCRQVRTAGDARRADPADAGSFSADLWQSAVGGVSNDVQRAMVDRSPSEMDPGLMISPDILNAAEVLWRYHCVYDELRPSDAIVGLGSYDLRVADRVAELYLAGFAPKVVFTGAFGHWTRERFTKTEAQTFAERAIGLGVPAEALLLEERATNIGENIRFTAVLLPDCARVILVTKPQTQRRVRATAAKQWPHVTALVTAPIFAFREQPAEGHRLDHLIHEMVGDLYRIYTYPEVGFQVREDVPTDVAAAYEFLVERGYDKHIPGR
jgi:uncharacterized SAM-binding protein YcdF (DUF218 family)